MHFSCALIDATDPELSCTAMNFLFAEWYLIIVMKTYPYVGLVLMALLVMVIHSHGFFLGHKNGMHARIIATAAIYQKVGERRGGKSSRGGGRGERNEGERGKEMGGKREGGKRELGGRERSQILCNPHVAQSDLKHALN